MADEPTWDILICSIAERTELLTGLLGGLGRQLRPGVGIRVFRDNLERAVGEKRRRLVESSRAEYVSFVDDDDEVPEDYVDAVRAALAERPDYVGFKVRWSQDGWQSLPVFHSLVHGAWIDGAHALYRDLSHLNPLRRDAAVRARFDGGVYEDRRWVTELRALGLVRTEVFIDREMYHYRCRSDDCHLTERTPMADPPARPDVPFVTWIDP